MSDHEPKDEGAKGARKGDAKDAKEELFEAIDHFKNAASILFNRATQDPTVRSATKEAERIAKKIGEAAEPLAKQLTGEITRLTRDVLSAVEGGTTRKSKTKAKRTKDEEEG
ncbi:MAG TPA: hypothetical protein VIL20_02315 [Sandaracinaceae bacterium]